MHKSLLVAAVAALFVVSCGGVNPGGQDGGGGSGGSGGLGGSGGAGGGLGGSGGSGGTGGSGGAGGGAGGGTGGAGGGGGSSSSDGGCTTACDCDPGLGCFQGGCISGFAPVYCCIDKTNCTGFSACQYPTGNYSTCNATDGGFSLRDGGFARPDSGFDYCPLLRCDGGTRCTSLGCTACGAGGTCTK
jgi:hypothetical protein